MSPKIGQADAEEPVEMEKLAKLADGEPLGWGLGPRLCSETPAPQLGTDASSALCWPADLPQLSFCFLI